MRMFVLCLVGVQVKLFMTWVAYLGSRGSSMKDALWINLDETPIKSNFGGRVGPETEDGIRLGHERQSIFEVCSNSVHLDGCHQPHY